MKKTSYHAHWVRKSILQKSDLHDQKKRVTKISQKTRNWVWEKKERERGGGEEEEEEEGDNDD